MISIRVTEDTSHELGTVILTVSGLGPAVSSVRYAVRQRAGGESLIIASAREGRWQRSADAWLVPEDAWYDGADLKLRIGPAVTNSVDPGIPYDFILAGEGLEETTVCYVWPREIPLEPSPAVDELGPKGADRDGRGVRRPDPVEIEKQTPIIEDRPGGDGAIVDPPQEPHDEKGPDKEGEADTGKKSSGLVQRKFDLSWLWPHFFRKQRVEAPHPVRFSEGEPGLHRWYAGPWPNLPVFIVALLHPGGQVTAQRPASSLPWFNVAVVSLIILLLAFLARTSLGHEVVTEVAGYFSPVTKVVDERRRPNPTVLAQTTQVQRPRQGNGANHPPPAHDHYTGPNTRNPPGPWTTSGQAHPGPTNPPGPRNTNGQTQLNPTNPPGPGTTSGQTRPGPANPPGPGSTNGQTRSGTTDRSGPGQTRPGRRDQTGPATHERNDTTPVPPEPQRPALSPLLTAVNDINAGNCQAGIAELKNLGSDPDALYRLAKIYVPSDMAGGFSSANWGPCDRTIPDRSTALGYLQRSANTGYGPAEFVWAKLARARGDIDTARTFFKSAAHHGVRDADIELLNLR